MNVRVGTECKWSDFVKYSESDQERAFWDDVRNLGYGVTVDKWMGGSRPAFPELWLLGAGRAAKMAPAAIKGGWKTLTGRYAYDAGKSLGDKIGPRVGDALGKTFKWTQFSTPLASQAASLYYNTQEDDPPEMAKEVLPWISRATPSPFLPFNWMMSHYLSENPDVMIAGASAAGKGGWNWYDKIRRGTAVPLSPSVAGVRMSPVGAALDGFLSGLNGSGENMRGQLSEILGFLGGEINDDDLSLKTKAYMSQLPEDVKNKMRDIFNVYRDYKGKASTIASDVAIAAPVIKEYYRDIKGMGTTNAANNALAASRIAARTIPAGIVISDDIKGLGKPLKDMARNVQDQMR